MPKSRAQQGGTREQLIEAALATLKEEGYAGASSRAIARRGGLNQALVFYHFGSVDKLLLAALDRTSEQRLAHYREALADVGTLEELVEVAARIYREDRASGHVTVVSQMVAGSVANPELAGEMIARMEPWIDFSEAALARVVAGTPLEGALPLRELAYATVTFYLGANLVTHLDPEHSRTNALLERLGELAPMAGMLLGPKEAPGPEGPGAEHGG
jgi:AcrR family transcriptional regulator